MTAPTREEVEELAAALDGERGLRSEASKFLRALQSTIDTLTSEIAVKDAALEEIAESRDTGRHDGHPEPYPAHSDYEMWGIANNALQTSNPRAQAVREVVEKAEDFRKKFTVGRGPDGSYDRTVARERLFAALSKIGGGK